MQKVVFVDRGFRWLLIVLLLLLQLWFLGEVMHNLSACRIYGFENPCLAAQWCYRPLGCEMFVFCSSVNEDSNGRTMEDFRNYLRQQKKVLFSVEEWCNDGRLRFERNQVFFYFFWVLDTLFLGLLLLKKDWYLKYVLFLTMGGCLLIWAGYWFQYPSPSMRYLDEIEFLPPLPPQDHATPYLRSKKTCERDGKQVFIYVALRRSVYASSAEEARKLLKEN